ncbi:YqzG/YhdC family protein [Alicyclobacillus fastidiosus]|uniref:YqzG/YhdC family protein n=1 Tax=Alicyclobacillus fastidiosus TaxID=392011 RepID=A0ABY6ZLY8_9BACL|nr:DUF3889 domain-containing protein [Alicyclobacillus fastidiosus]WAH42980.1 YqzG/YhdC family protein [Alicyclobacillus fastidiosus]GMA64947.1 hypothetical protein GCM10025859_53870 [Alicyclobacillus fastidiosus]
MKVWFLLLAFCISSVCLFDKAPAIALASGVSNIAKPTPTYSKWGLLAVQEAKKRYPNSLVIDYKSVSEKPAILSK